jgi:hypothetical protein
MILRQTSITGLLVLAVSTMTASLASAQTETFSATAEVKTAGAATTTAPVTIVVERKTAQSDADRMAAAFKTGGAAALRKALAGAPPTGTVQLGAGAATPTRLTIERTTDKGRLLTIVADQPILFLGAGVPGAKAKAGYDFAIIDIEFDAKGSGAGTLAPAAKITFKQGTFVVEDYAAELVRMTGVKKTK